MLVISTINFWKKQNVLSVARPQLIDVQDAKTNGTVQETAK